MGEIKFQKLPREQRRKYRNKKRYMIYYDLILGKWIII
jgi:hypothetical protein